ncbi:N-acetyl-1-D-myo-inositol-2-amino-2-deoxy-alpha-D -glucopyranoside deacetylase [Catenulispora yoronensis]|uniref:1D-myo-inositol 2-acetamido-2-deoxy-alpha-D-glucopyranoside deacetylase n=1 Tax=Catenulispora yoronensis TaxID=450799 RepID=A0ABN2TNI3_9ACTN
MADADPRCLLLVHAHPDDETIDNGATMARYAAEGVHVALVTCTLGEEGDIVVPELAHLGAAHEDRLAEHREGELRNAMSALGVTDHRILRGADRYRDSGMMGSPSNDHPRSFWRADPDEAALPLADIIRELRPQVMVTYGPDGGYGHPDHIQTHRVAMRAAELAGLAVDPPGGREPHIVSKIYWNCHPRSAARFSAKALQAENHTPFLLDESAISVTDDSFATCVIDGSGHLAAKAAALRAHATQLSVHGPFFALSNNVGRLIAGEEHYHLAHRRPDLAPAGRLEGDLFAGI